MTRRRFVQLQSVAAMGSLGPGVFLAYGRVPETLIALLIGSLAIYLSKPTKEFRRTVILALVAMLATGAAAWAASLASGSRVDLMDFLLIAMRVFQATLIAKAGLNALRRIPVEPE